MRKWILAFALLLASAGMTCAQVNNQLTGSGPPSGSCTSSQTYLDTTNHIGYHCNNEQWVPDATNFTRGPIVCAPQFSTTDTITSATSPTETFFTTNCSIPANTIITNQVLNGIITLDWTATATVPNFTFKVKLCTVLGCGSGTVKDIFISTVSPPAAGTFSCAMSFVIQGRSPAGATAGITSGFVGSSGANTPFGRNTISSNLGNIPTNGIMFLSFSAAFSTSAAGNSMTLTSLVFN